MSSIPRCEAASISTTSSEVPFAIATQAWHVLSGVAVGPLSQLRALARMRAIEVLPVPLGPVRAVERGHSAILARRPCSVGSLSGERVLTRRELNRALLERQLLLARA